MFELFDPAAEFVIRESAHLPHWYQPGAACFITFRTDDSIPRDLSARWHLQRADWLTRHGISLSDPYCSNRIAELPVLVRKEYHERFSGAYLAYLDEGWGACVLKRSELAMHVANALRHFDGNRYHLGDFVVMPNHVHLMVAFLDNTDVQKQCYSWKKFSATQINRALGKQCRFWKEESFDHLIRSPEQFVAIQHYIRDNPKLLNPGEYLLSSST